MRAIDKEYPKATDNILQILSAAKKEKYSQKEAFKILVTTPELLDPLLFLLFTNDTNLEDAISYEEYISVMKNKAIKTKNQGLLNLVKTL